MITSYENLIRYSPKDPRAANAFRAIVRAASTPEQYDRNLEYADLVDIEGARFDDQNGELILIGPRVRDQKNGYLPPLLLVDDFAVVLKALHADERGARGVTIGMFNGRLPDPAQIEQMRRSGQAPVEYVPESIAGTHVGSVLFHADLALKALAFGKDPFTYEPAISPFPGFRAVPDIARVAADQLAPGPVLLASYCFAPKAPSVVMDGYSMRFVAYEMRIKHMSSVKDAALQQFADQVTRDFDKHAQERVVFSELVRLHKLIQVAKWYKASGFPFERLKSYRSLPFEPVKTTRLLEAPVSGKQVSYVGGLRLLPAETVELRAAPGQWLPILAARPNRNVSSWIVQVDGRTLQAIAIPVAARGASHRAADPQKPTRG